MTRTPALSIRASLPGGGTAALAPPDAPAVVDALRNAERVCITAGQRWTPARARVFGLLARAGGPVKPYDLVDLYRRDRSTSPPTVYRCLEALIGLGLAHRVVSLRAYIACRHPDVDHAPAFLICGVCASVEELPISPRPLMDDVGQHTRFLPTSLGVEVAGLCEACAGRRR